MIRVVSLVENTSRCGCRTAHGLSLYIETRGHKVLFDLGKDDTFLVNAKALGVDIEAVDTVIISHGHYDHGGALSLFLEHNHTAKVYVQRQAFAPHFNHRASGIGYIGLENELKNHPQVLLLDGDFKIDSELKLFRVTDNSLCQSSANQTFYEGDVRDTFQHEQNLIINANTPLLVMGCGHNGVVNIMKRAEEFSPKICIGGFHLTNPSAQVDEPKELIDSVIENLKMYSDVEFHTCHCTGENVYKYMRTQMSNIHYFACGDSLTFDQ